MSSAEGFLDKLERLAGKATIAIVLSLILLSISDYVFGIVLNSFYKNADNLFPKEIFLEPRPFTVFGGTRDPKLGAAENLNSLGYRGPVPTLPKPTDEFRIVMLGGSTVLLGSPSLSQLIEERFHSDGFEHVHVYNFGVVSSTLRMDLARFVFEVADFDPDLVIFYGGGNDIGLPYQGDPRPSYPPNFMAYEYNPLILAGTNEQSWTTLFKLALFHSRTIRALAGRELRLTLVPFEKIRGSVGWGSTEWSRQIGSAILGDVGRIAKLTRGYGTRSMFVFQPLMEFKLRPSVDEKKRKDPEIETHAEICRKIVRGGVEDSIKGLPIKFLDLSTIFDSTDDSVFWDGIHIYQQYQPVVAGEIYNFIKSEVVGKGVY